MISMQKPDSSTAIPRMQQIIVACNFLKSILLALSGYALWTQGTFYGRWMKSPLQYVQNLFPYPDIVSRIFLERLSFQSDLHRTSLLLCSMAVFMGALGIGLLISWRWAFLAENIVCLVAIAGRFFALADLTSSKYSFQPNQIDNWFYFLGLIPAAAFAFYSWSRFVHPLGSSAKKPAAEQARSTAEMPVGAFFLSGFALFFYGVYVSTTAEHMDYWPKRYMAIHAVLVGVAYVAVMILAGVSRLRVYAGSAAIGIAVASLFALNPQGTVSPLYALVHLAFVIASLANSEPAAIFAALFLLGNLLLFITALRHVQWRSTNAPLILAVAALFVAGTGPITGAVQRYESNMLKMVKDQSGLVPGRMFAIQGCLVQWSHANLGISYPRSLPELNAAVPGCIDPSIARGAIVDGFRYTLGSSDNRAGVHRFQLLADSVHTIAKAHVAFFSDESFVLRKTEEAGIPAERSRAYTRVSQFGSFLGGIQNHTFLERERIFWEKNHATPPRETLDASEIHYPDTLVASQAPGYFPSSTKPHDENSFADDSYVYRYQKIPGPPENFKLTMRPAKYGATSVLSFYEDNTGIVRATPEDREATAADAVTYQCAYDIYSPDCTVPVATGPVDLEKLFPKGREQPPQEAYHPGGLAVDGTPKLFWSVNNDMPKFLTISEDAQLLYVTNVLTGISALRTSDGSVAWTLPGGTKGLAGGGSLYALDSHGLLMKIDSAGKIVWEFSAINAKQLIRARSGTLYVPGMYLYAINENGELLWRMQIPEYRELLPALSPDEKVLYIAGTANLFAIDATSGVIRWKASNPCYGQAPACAPRLLSNGSVALESVEERKASAGSSAFDYRIRVLSANGEELWSRRVDYGTEFVVPPGTSMLVVRDSDGLEILDRRGTSLGTRAGRWISLNVTQRPGLFFSCFLPMRYYDLHGFDAGLREILQMSWDHLGSTDCVLVHSGPGNLLFYEGVDSVHGQNALWSFVLP